MPESQPEKAPTPSVAETPKANPATPTPPPMVEKVLEPPVVKTEAPTPSVAAPSAHPVVQAPTVNPLTTFKGTLAEKIVAFLDSRKTGGFIKLNDFLKAQYPAPNVPGGKTGWGGITAMSSIRQTLLDLQASGKIVFSNQNYKRFGQHYYDSGDPVTKYYNLGNLDIEVKLA